MQLLSIACVKLKIATIIRTCVIDDATLIYATTNEIHFDSSINFLVATQTQIFDSFPSLERFNENLFDLKKRIWLLNIRHDRPHVMSMFNSRAVLLSSRTHGHHLRPSSKFTEKRLIKVEIRLFMWVAVDAIIALERRNKTNTAVWETASFSSWPWFCKRLQQQANEIIWDLCWKMFLMIRDGFVYNFNLSGSELLWVKMISFFLSFAFNLSKANEKQVEH